MLAALFLAVIPVLILHKLQTEIQVHDKRLLLLSTIALMVLLVQIVIGTDIREQVDVVSKSLSYGQRETWIAQLNNVFSVHKIVAIITSVLVIIVFWLSLSHPMLQKKGFALLLIVLALMAAGLSLASFNIPAFIQPVHLLLSSILFVSLFAFRLNVKK
jgi:cytochrome c oxidase assembly protein subunit 15